MSPGFGRDASLPLGLSLFDGSSFAPVCQGPWIVPCLSERWGQPASPCRPASKIRRRDRVCPTNPRASVLWSLVASLHRAFRPWFVTGGRGLCPVARRLVRSFSDSPSLGEAPLSRGVRGAAGFSPGSAASFDFCSFEVPGFLSPGFPSGGEAWGLASLSGSLGGLVTCSVGFCSGDLFSGDVFSGDRGLSPPLFGDFEEVSCRRDACPLHRPSEPPSPLHLDRNPRACPDLWDWEAGPRRSGVCRPVSYPPAHAHPAASRRVVDCQVGWGSPHPLAVGPGVGRADPVAPPPASGRRAVPWPVLREACE